MCRVLPALSQEPGAPYRGGKDAVYTVLSDLSMATPGGPPVLMCQGSVAEAHCCPSGNSSSDGGGQTVGWLWV